MTKVANFMHSPRYRMGHQELRRHGRQLRDADGPLGRRRRFPSSATSTGPAPTWASSYGSKAIFNAEYTDGGNNQSTTVTPADTAFCSSDNTDGINGELFDMDLDGQVRVPCSCSIPVVTTRLTSARAKDLAPPPVPSRAAARITSGHPNNTGPREIGPHRPRQRH